MPAPFSCSSIGPAAVPRSSPSRIARPSPSWPAQTPNWWPEYTAASGWARAGSWLPLNTATNPRAPGRPVEADQAAAWRWPRRNRARAAASASGACRRRAAIRRRNCPVAGRRRVMAVPVEINGGQVDAGFYRTPPILLGARPAANGLHPVTQRNRHMECCVAASKNVDGFSTAPKVRHSSLVIHVDPGDPMHDLPAEPGPGPDDEPAPARSPASSSSRPAITAVQRDRVAPRRRRYAPLHLPRLRARARRWPTRWAAWACRWATGSRTLAWNGYRHLELYYAVSGSGAVLHTINPRLHPEQVAYIATMPKTSTCSST
jgi:hypothetical protein